VAPSQLRHHDIDALAAYFLGPAEAMQAALRGRSNWPRAPQEHEACLQFRRAAAAPLRMLFLSL